MMQRPRGHDPGQLALWGYCDICGGPAYRAGQHRACWAALDRWMRPDNLADWADPNRIAL